MKVLKMIFSKKVMKPLIILLVIAGLGGGGYYMYKNISAAKAVSTTKEMTAKVTKGDLEVSISGTGTVQPISRYDIVPLVKGNILNAPFEEGMDVKAGELLYKIDDSDLSYNIQKAQNGIEKLRVNSQESYDNINNLVVYAPFDGRITGLTAKEGEQIGNNGKIADVIDSRTLTAKVQYNKVQAANITVGQKAQLLIPEFMTYIDGRVKYVNSTAKASTEGGLMFDVEIEASNPGEIIEGTKVTGIIKAQSGDLISPSLGTVNYSNKQAVNSQTTGKIKQVLVKNDEWVKAGQKILVLENDNINDTIYKNSLDMKDSQLSLEAQKKQLNDYNIISPISGKVIKKNYKTGDTINNNSDSKVLMTIADMSKMIFTMDVDELDIAKIAINQKVVVTADALPGSKFEGEVTSVSVEGKSQNGVTTYPVQVTIASPGKLKPGMNVNAKIQVENKKDVLYLPISAVTKVGDKAFVFTKSANVDNSKNTQNTKQSENKNDNSNNQGNQQRQQRNSSGEAQRNGNSNGSVTPNSSNRSGSTMEGRQRKEVVVGINNDNLIEIVSGLSEGETVYLPTLSNNNTVNTQQQGMMGGGMRIQGGGAASGNVQRPRD